MNLEVLKAVAKSTSDDVLTKFIEPLDSTFSRYDIKTPQRQAMFLAQVAVESWYFQRMEENLNYSVNTLLRIFPKYFTPSIAPEFANKPEKIANKVYGGKYGNGPEASGDGWKYRGRGLIALTFKDNYIAFSQHISKSIEDTISYLQTPEGAAEVAGWFWERMGCNELADKKDIITCTVRINGGMNNLSDRNAIYIIAKKVLNVT